MYEELNYLMDRINSDFYSHKITSQAVKKESVRKRKKKYGGAWFKIKSFANWIGLNVFYSFINCNMHTFI